MPNIFKTKLGRFKGAITEMRRSDDGLSHRCVKIADREADVELVIDLEKLATYGYGRRAVESKGRKVTLAGESIVFRVIESTEHETPA